MTATDPTLRALAHPVRLRMMSLTWTVPRSAAELARDLGISHTVAGRHLRRLATAGLVEPADVRPDHGGQEHRYQAVRGTTPSGQPQRQGQGQGGTTDPGLWLSPDAWDDFRHRLAALLVNLHEEARAPRTPGTVHVGATVTAFPLRERETSAPDAADADADAIASGAPDLRCRVGE